MYGKLDLRPCKYHASLSWRRKFHPTHLGARKLLIAAASERLRGRGDMFVFSSRVKAVLHSVISVILVANLDEIEYLYGVGLTAEQIYEYFVYVATGVRVPVSPVKVK